MIVQDCPKCLEPKNITVLNNRGLFHVRCNNCGFESEEYYNVVNAVLAWNELCENAVHTKIERLLDDNS